MNWKLPDDPYFMIRRNTMLSGNFPHRADLTLLYISVAC